MDPYDRNLPPPRRRGMGCFAKGCLTLVVVGCLLVALFVYFSYQGYKHISAYVATEPAEIRVVPGTDEQYQELQARLGPFLNGIETNHRVTLNLSADDLNMLVAREPNFANLRGKAAFAMAGGYLIVDFSRTLDDTGRNKEYYLNGRAEAAIDVDAGEVKLSPHRLFLNGKPLPAWILQLLNNRDFVKSSGGLLDDEINRQPQLRDFLRRLRTAHVDGDHLVLTSVGEPVAAPPAAP